jgi:uncharacterized membrane protein
MLPDPLHPAIVHLPIALAVLLPLLATIALVAIRSAWLPRRAWSAVVLLAGLLVVGSWAALETGEQDEERVERIVTEDVIEAHEEAAEVFASLAVVLFLCTGAGLMAGRTGELARAASILVALGLLVSGARVGHLGGELVYTHGAAAAHVDAAGPALARAGGGDHHDDHDDDD